MRPASIFLIIQLSNSRESCLEEKAGNLLHTPALIGYEELTEVSAEE